MSGFSLTPLLANKRLESVPVYQPGKPIEELERELGIRGAIKMASNENPFGPSPKAVRAAKSALTKVNRYPDAGSFYLKAALSKKFGVLPNRVVLGNGSDELIVLAMRAFAGKGDEVLTAVPTFLIYRIAAMVQGATPVEVPMKNMRYDLSRIASAVTRRTKVIFIANPDNPVGTYVTHGELSVFLDRVPERCIVFIDEAYYEFARLRKDYPRSMEFLSRPNVIVSRTFSKAYGLSGLRVGYAFSSAEVVQVMNKVREPFNINLPAQAAAQAALADSKFLSHVTRVTEEQKMRLTRELTALGADVVPSATNFILVFFGMQAVEIYERLLRMGIIVRSMKNWGLDGYIRITIGTPRENSFFFRKLKVILNSIQWRKST